MNMPALVQSGVPPAASSMAALAMRAAAARAAAVTAGRPADAVDLLASLFPAVQRLVGEDSFRVMARRYMLSEPARRSPRRGYGDAFPRFLRSLGGAASFEYVADIAELEMLRDKAARAADARPLALHGMSKVSLGQLKRLRAVLHPAVFLQASRFPVVTIWENNRSDGEPRMIGCWRPESALVARPRGEVEVRRLPGGGHAFIAALARGETVSAAVDAGRVAAGDFDVGAILMLLIEARIVIDFREDTRPVGAYEQWRTVS
jgi:hypothetical protein